MTQGRTLAEAIVGACRSAGVRRIFGIPGGGSGLDLIEAATKAELDFVLTRSETAAVIMAAVTAELDGTLAVALTGRGPGLANAVNGIAHAWLDRSPVLVITEGIDPGQESWVTHQTFDQLALVAPITKARARLDGADPSGQVTRLMNAALAVPMGPVLLELPPIVARQPSPAIEPPRPAPLPSPRSDRIDDAVRLLGGAERPVIVAGLDAREEGVASGLAALAQRLSCPVLTTYKAKGVVDSTDPLVVGLYTGGSAEAECVGAADLIVTVGLDAVELIPAPWRYLAPVLRVATHGSPIDYHEPRVLLEGPIAANLERLRAAVGPSGWRAERIAAFRVAMEARLDQGSATGLDARALVETVGRMAPPSHRLTVDAGAHMVSAMAYSVAHRPFDVLISNGLATMAFALPAAIASALRDPERLAIAITGDGGLLMCLGELHTAVERGCRLIVLVANDGSLSLIDLKQQKRGFRPVGVRWARRDFARVMEGLGGTAYHARTGEELDRTLERALAATGPVLIDAQVDPTGYGRQLEALRG
ncbi:MAG: thiamine pyrophosphate-binding protein [Gemmatimonadales bacterium]